MGYSDITITMHFGLFIGFLYGSNDLIINISLYYVYVVCPLTVQLVYVFSLTSELNYILTEVTCFSVLMLVNPFEFL